MCPACEHSRRVFVLMPFRDNLKELLDEGVRVGAKRAGAIAERVDEQIFADSIVERISEQIAAADAVIAIMIGNRPNVLYELGLAHALRKHVILVTDNPDDIPFDLKHNRHIVHRNDNERLADGLAAELEWCWQNPRPTSKYDAMYRHILGEIADTTGDLFPHLAPVAERRFDEWLQYSRSLLQGGVPMTGPERLKITESLLCTTKTLRIVQPFVSDANKLHSKDWIRLYDRIGARSDLEKQWILCADIDPTEQANVKSLHQFYASRGFITRYCRPRDLLEAMGQVAPSHVIENFGSYVKLVEVPAHSFVQGAKPNELVTVFRECTEADLQQFESIATCCEDMDAAWLQNHCS